MLIVAKLSARETALGNLFADALRESIPGADVALSYGPGRGGLRADLPPGVLTFGPVYDLERYGVRLVASPRHADVLLVTGPVTRNMADDLLDKLFGGSLAQMVNHLLTTREVSPAELSKLEDLIAERKKS